MGNRKDHYYNKSKQEGYRSRAAYKLKQLDAELGLLFGGATVVDLGAAPGGWSQVAAEEVNEHGKVIGVDFQRISDLEDSKAHVTTIRGDMTESDTCDEITDIAGQGGVDVVLSDMAPNMTGEYSVDHARSVHLARMALDTAREVLVDGGHFAVKVFDGRDFEEFREDVEDEFAFTRVLSPDASRDSSSELYVVGKNYVNAPVAEDDTLEVEIVGEGDEGDGVAKIEGYTLFIPNVEEGESVEITITAVKPNFGFAERRD